MTLSKQLMMIILILFLFVFLGTFFISIDNTRNFIQNQLASHAQDTATSLGLSLSPHMANNDMPTMERMVDAIFDRGYYKQLSVETINGEDLISRNNTLQIEGIPSWFIDMVPLETPRGEALIMSGWNQAGNIYVYSHPGYAYEELWQNVVATFWWFAGSACAALLMGLIALRFVLKPLRAVEKQAEAICNREYALQENIPWTRELRQMVEAMNKMARKVKQHFTEQTALTEKLRNQAFKDSLTGLGNRRYFDSQLQQRVDSPEEFGHGALFLIKIHDFAGINERHGYKVADTLLQETTSILNQSCKKYSSHFICRLNGAEFAIVISDVSNNEAEHLAENICQSMLQLESDELADENNPIHIGIAFHQHGQEISTLLSSADMALHAAQKQSKNAWVRQDHTALTDKDIRGANEWQDFLTRVINEKNIVLHYQPVTVATKTNRSQHYPHEVLLRIPSNDGLLSAGVFMPMAERSGMVIDIDKLIIGQIIEYLTNQDKSTQSYSINLSAASISDSTFTEWLYAQMRSHPDCANRLVFELSEHGVLQNLETMQNFCNNLDKLGSAISIDHFGRGFSSFGYLRKLKVRYVKIDGGFVRDVDKNDDHQFFIHALTDTLHSIDIEVIAEAVETDDELNTLKLLHVDGIQGYLISKPKPLE